METTLDAPRLSFVTLPMEIIEYVLSLLYPLELVPFRQVSKLFRDLIDSSPELQLAIELIHDGLLLHHRGSPTVLPAKVLMDHVLARRRAWETLDPRSTWDEDCVDTNNTQYEVSDGIWAHSFDRVGNGPFTGLKYRELAPTPSQSDAYDSESGDEDKPWECTIGHLGMSATDFSFNACHDVQILMEPIYDNTVRRMHFRRISTNEVHPDAAAPYLDIFAKDCSVWSECQTIAYQNRVLLLFSEWEGSRNCAVMVIDWKLSKAVLPFTRVADAAFVSSYRILLLHLSDHQGGPCIDLHSLATESSTSTILCRFHLPSPFPVNMGLFFTHPGSRFGEDQSSSSAFGAPPSERNAEGARKFTTRGQSPVHQAKLFTTDPRSEILGCWLHEWRGSDQLFMVLCIGRMIKFYEANVKAESSMDDHDVEKRENVPNEESQLGDGASQTEEKPSPEIPPTHEDDDSDSEETRAGYIVPKCSLSFPWEEWGPDSSRCLPPQEIINGGFRTTAGSRMAVWDAGTNLFRVVRLAVLDFNPLPIRRAKLKKELELQGLHSHMGLGGAAMLNTDSSQVDGENDNRQDPNGEGTVGEVPVTSQFNGEKGVERPDIEITDRLVIRTVTSPTITRFSGSSVKIETRLPYRVFTLRWDFNYENVFLDNTTIIGRRAESYHFFSFLPRFDEPEEKTPLLGVRPVFLPPLNLINLQGSMVPEENEFVAEEEGEEDEDQLHIEDGQDEDIDDQANEEVAQGASTLLGEQFIDFNVEDVLELLSNLENSTSNATGGVDEQQ